MPPLFGSRKPAAPPPSAAQETRAAAATLSAQLNRKEIELYPLAVKMLWYFYDPADHDRPTAGTKEYPGPIDETISDSVRELEKVALLEVIPTFSDFSITARLSPTGLSVMASQATPGRFVATEVEDPASRAVTIYRAVNLG